MKKVQNYFILDILSEVRFIYNNQDEIEEIGISLYIENIKELEKEILTLKENSFKEEFESLKDMIFYISLKYIFDLFYTILISNDLKHSKELDNLYGHIFNQES